MKMVFNGVKIRRMGEVVLIAAGEDISLKVKGHGVHGHGEAGEANGPGVSPCIGCSHYIEVFSHSFS